MDQIEAALAERARIRLLWERYEALSLRMPPLDARRLLGLPLRD